MTRMNPEAEFFLREKDQQPSSGECQPELETATVSTAGATAGSTANTSSDDASGLTPPPDSSSSEAIASHVSDSNNTATTTADATTGPEPNGIHSDDIHGNDSGDNSGPTTHATADPVPGPTAVPSAELPPDPSCAPIPGPPGPGYYYGADATAEAVSGPPPGFYFNHDPGFDPRYGQPYQMIYNPHQPPPPPLSMYRSPMPYYNPNPAYPPYPPCPIYPPNHMSQYQYGYPAGPHAYTPPPPVYAASAPPPPPPMPSPAPFHYRAHVHTHKLGGFQGPAPHRKYPGSTEARGEVGDPDAKIFVGDLPIGGTKGFLESCLKGLFVPFGPCDINVSWGETGKRGTNVRNGVNQREEKVKILPTGWIQYMEAKDAEKVLATAKERGLYLGPRRLRIERADGKRIVRLWPKDAFFTVTMQDLRQEFHRLINWLDPDGTRKYVFHISDSTEDIKKSNGIVRSVGVMFRWCEDAHYAAERFPFFPSNFHLRIEPVRTMTGTPSWRESKLDCAARLGHIELDPGHEWRDNMPSMYTEAIDDIYAELEEEKEKKEEKSFDESSGNNNAQPSANRRPRLSTANSSVSSSGTASPSTLEDIEYEREKKARKAKHWSNVLQRAEEASFSNQNENCSESLTRVLDTVKEEGEENEENTENEEKTWDDNSDTVVAHSDSGVSETVEETREEPTKCAPH